MSYALSLGLIICGIVFAKESYIIAAGLFAIAGALEVFVSTALRDKTDKK